MSFMTASLEDSWRPSITGDTMAAGYWLNWRVLLCSMSLVFSTGFSAYLILRNEGFLTWRGGGDGLDRHRRGQAEAEAEEEKTLYEEETWSPCFHGVHPAWLLAYRVVAFAVLTIMLMVISFIDGPTIYYYYTQWTLLLITIFFGLGSLLSFYGCYEYHQRVDGEKIDCVDHNSEQGAYTGVTHSKHHSHALANMAKSSISDGGVRKTASGWGYIFQILFQMNAGAVVLTDCVFWFIIVPFLAINKYNLSMLDINMHSVNVVLLLGDTALNSLQFPLFRIGYFFMWTVIYVIFQRTLHAFVGIWWPYPFLDLSTPFAPLWYFSVALMHLPCYGIFALVIKLKQALLNSWFPESYKYAR